MDFSAGIVVFNPKDDKRHLSVIKTAVECLYKSCIISKHDCQMSILYNISIGNGEETEKYIRAFCDNNKVHLIEFSDTNTMVGCYNRMLKYHYEETDADYFTVFGDDHYCPSFWIDIMINNFKKHKNAGFIMPVGVNLPQKELNKNITETKWDESIARKFINNSITKTSSNVGTIECGVFARSSFKKLGYIDKNFKFSVWQWDYIGVQMKNKNICKYIAHNIFIWHVGKSANITRYPSIPSYEKRMNCRWPKDCPFPNEKENLEDIAYWNKKYNRSLKPWWK